MTSDQQRLDAVTLFSLEEAIARGKGPFAPGPNQPAMTAAQRRALARQRDALRSKLARSSDYLPARGMAAAEMAFAKASHEPERHIFLAEKVAAAVSKRDWSGYLSSFGSHERMFPFLSIHAQLTDAEYWPVLADVWVDSEWMQEFGLLWSWLMVENRGSAGAKKMMNKEERKRWDGLPKRFTIYRGQRRLTDPAGLSWTLSPTQAYFFADTYRPRFTREWQPGNGGVLIGTVEKSDALAFLNGREEEEILVPIGKVRGVRPL